MALYIGLDVSLRMTSICVVEADGSSVWEAKAESEPVPLVKVLTPWRDKTALVGIEACPLSEWLRGATRITEGIDAARPRRTAARWQPVLARGHNQNRSRHDAG